VSEVSLPVIGQEPWGESLNACLEWLYDEVERLSSQVTSLNDLEAQVTALTAQVAVNTAEIDTNRTLVISLNNEVLAMTPRVAALEADVAMLKHRFSTVGRWQTNTQVGAVPGGMQVTSDTGNFFQATWLRFAKIDQTSTEMSEMLKDATMFIIQHQNDSSMWVHMEATGPVSVQSTYVQIPIRCIGQGKPGQAWQNVVVTMTVILGP
jgi:hypothetical protein